MENINRVFLLGTVADSPVPECKYTSSGLAVLNFTILTEETYRDNVRREWHKVVAWGQRAEEIAPQISRGGVTVFIEGRLKTDSWVDRQSGQKRYATKINADKVCCLGADVAAAAPQSQAPVPKPTPRPEPRTPTTAKGMDDVPF